MNYYGTYEHSVDAKNRMFVPAKFKDVLGDSFKLTYTGLKSCICVYSNDQWQKFEEQLSTLPSVEFDSFITEVYSNTVDVQLDSQGRVVLPTFLKDKVNIQKNVLVLGVRDHLEIWSKDVYNDHHSHVDMNKLRELMIGRSF